jgi:transposase
MENIISIDESSMDTHISNNYGWSKKGIKIENILKHSKIRYSLILAINCKKIIHKKIIKGSANGEIFLKFIKDLVKKLQNKNKKYILLDNAKIHHYKKIKDFINTKPKIKLIYNIPYTPETNPIERVFGDIKRDLKNKKINNNNLIDELKESLNDINQNNNFKAYYNKSLIDEIKKLK